jgi:cysteine synthase A
MTPRDLPDIAVRPPPLAKSIAEAMGNTQMVELSLLPRVKDFFVSPTTGEQIPAEAFRLLVKLEYLQPGLSKKDRTALHLVLSSVKKGGLKPGQPVIELTSGNTGTGLAIVCRSLGHRFTAVMSKGNSPERARMMRALGAEVILVDQAEGSIVGQVSGKDLALVEERTRELVKERGAFRADQFNLWGNVEAHYSGTGPEIWIQAEERVDVFADFVGTGGSFAGIAKFLKEKNKDCFCVAAEPLSSRVLSGVTSTSEEQTGHAIQGGGYSFSDLPLLDKQLVDAFVGISDQEAIDGSRLLATEEGIFAGFSAGANLAAAAKALGMWWDSRTEDERKKAVEGEKVTVVFLACDSGLKYLSTDLYPR